MKQMRQQDGSQKLNTTFCGTMTTFPEPGKIANFNSSSKMTESARVPDPDRSSIFEKHASAGLSQKEIGLRARGSGDYHVRA